MICAIVLAAGRSERMGTQKLLLPLGKKPVIARVVDELIASPLQQIIVVVGRDAGLIQSALAGRALTFVSNPDAEGDMLSSVRCGLRAMPPSCKAVLMVLGDQPGITSELVAALMHAFRETGRGFVVPTHAGRRGHPLLFAMRFCDEVLTRYDGIGLRGLLTTHPDETLELEVSSAAALKDLDSPEDYRQFVKSAGA